MNTKKVILTHLGDQCGPGIIIKDILNIRKKTLFERSFCSFNQILKYLKNDLYHDIYDINHLVTVNGEKPLHVDQTISEDVFFHDHEVNNNLYGFTFTHNYKLDGLSILNYQFNVDSFKHKITNFQEDLADKDSFIYFINFERVMYNNEPKVDEMIDLLLEKRNGINNFKILFFTSSPERIEYLNKFKSNPKYKDYLHAILIDTDYSKWHLDAYKDRCDRYKKIYDEFYYNVDQRIRLQFPPFEETHYYKTMIKK